MENKPQNPLLAAKISLVPTEYSGNGNGLPSFGDMDRLIHKILCRQVKLSVNFTGCIESDWRAGLARAV